MHTAFRTLRVIPTSWLYLPRGTDMNNEQRFNPLQGHGWPAYLRMVLGHSLIFGLLGPAIGALFSPGVIIYPYAVFAAYWISFVAAIITGLLVGLGVPFVAHRNALYVLGAAIGAICAMIFPFAFIAHDAPMGLLIVFAFSGACAGLICTRMTRWLRLRWLSV